MYIERLAASLRANGCDVSVRELQDHVFLVGATRASSTDTERLVVLAVTDPDAHITTDQLRYLSTVSREKQADTAAVTKDGDIAPSVREAATKNGIEIIPSETVRGQRLETAHEEVDDSQSDPTEYEIYPSRPRMLFWLLLSTPLTVVSGAFLAAGPSEELRLFLISLVGFPLFLGGTVVLASRSIAFSPVVRIDESGISHNKLTSTQCIPWDRIESVGIETIDHRGGSTEMVQIVVTEFPQQPWWQQVLRELDKAASGGRDDAYYIPIESYGVSFDEVTDAVEQCSTVEITDRY